jgi:hypothetical protein
LANTNSNANANFDESERTIRALALELKRPLATIACLAELGDGQAHVDILDIAERSLALVDSYLLMAQTEYGQIALDLEPIGLGSVLHEISSQIRPRLTQNSVIVVDDRVHDPAMTNRSAINSTLTAFVDVLSESVGSTQREQTLVLRSYKSNKGQIGIGVFTDNILSASDIKKALGLQGKALMPLPGVSSHSGVSLMIAECLCRAIGGSLEVKRMGNLMGLATLLPKSEQLSLV